MPRLFMGVGVRVRWRTVLLIIGIAGTVGGSYVTKKWKQIKEQAHEYLAEERSGQK